MEKVKMLLIAAVITALTLFAINEASYVSQIERELTAAQSENNKYIIRREADSSQLVSLRYKLSTANGIKDNYAQIIKELEMRKPKEIVKVQTKIVTKTEIPLAQTNENNCGDSCLSVPQSFYKTDKWYSVGGTITKNAIQIDSFITKANFTYAVGDTLVNGWRGRFLGKSHQVVRLKIDNPNVQLTNFDNIYLMKKKRWYETAGAKIGFGFLLGFGLATLPK
jgi:hypothetical protein